MLSTLIRAVAVATLLTVPTLGVAQTTSSTAQAKATAPSFDLFVTFGDSLADTGNVFRMTSGLGFLPAVPPSVSPHRTYFEGRFSNGPVAFEYAWEALRGSNPRLQPILRLGGVPKKGGVDFAFGGSTSGFIGTTPGGFYVPGLLGQVDLFLILKRGSLPKKHLVAIVTGSNDYLTTPPVPPADPRVVVGNIVRAINKLYAAGVRTLVVVNISDLGAVPLVASQPPEARAALSALSSAHNALLSEALSRLAAERPALRLIPVDVNEVIASVPGVNFTTPAVDAMVTGWPYPFPPSACLFVDAATCPDVPTFQPDPTYFFWDAVHPTTAAHAGLGDVIVGRLQ